MNELDSEIMVGALEKKGLKRTYEEDRADIIIFNTCSVRDLAERKVLGKLGLLSRQTKKPIIGITGCMAMSKKEKLLKKFPHVDFILGTNNISDLNSVLDEVIKKRKQVAKIEERYEELNYLTAKRENKVRAYVSIIRGCSKFCTYCIVPFTRGKEVSRHPQSIVEECSQLAQLGYKEIILLGQNVNSYGKDILKGKCLFADLLYQLDKIGGIKRIRFMTSHPIDISIDLMQAIRDLPTVCEFVHLPLQSGSNAILKKMHRLYTKEQYLEKVLFLKELVPTIKLGTDIIVGFPTEKDDDFEQTYEFFKKIRYLIAFIFAYSPRKNTFASRFQDDVPVEIKQKRLQILLDLHHQINQQDAEEIIGKEVEVLVEGFNKDNKFLKGRTRWGHKVIFPGDKKMIGTLVKVTIDSYNHQTLKGKKVYFNKDLLYN